MTAHSPRRSVTSIAHIAGVFRQPRSFVDAHAPHGRALPLFARVYIDPCERSRRRRPQALGVLGERVCPTLAIWCP